MSSSLFLLALVAFTAALASDVPVLMWSPERPLRDLPQVPASNQVTQDSFLSDYLTRLLGKESNIIVAFLQDKLNINDISKYADVYNSNSDGGAFKNVKGLLDEHFSLELPRVLGSHRALSSLRDGFAGRVHEVTSTSDLSDLDLGGQGDHLVVVRLLPVAGAHNPEAVIASNDDVIGKVAQQLQKMKAKYTALYTAETSEDRPKREAHHGRQLMATPQEATSEGVFFNVTYGNGTGLYAYLTYLDLCMVPSFSSDKVPAFCPFNFSLSATDLKTADLTASMVNSTVNVVLKITGFKSNTTGAQTYDLTFTMPLKYQLDRWEILEATLTVKNNSVMINEEKMVMRGYDPVVSLLYSFHCSSMEWYPNNTTAPMLGYITLGGFQIQPFNVQSGGGFLPSQDCVGWFSTAIWMGLVVVGVHLMVLFLGVYLISSLSTNDRFDDPKGKPLIINAGE